MIADILETIVKGLQTAAKVNTVAVVDPRLPMAEVRADLPFLTLQPLLGRRVGPLLPVPTAIETVDNPDYPDKSPFAYLCRLIFTDDQHLPILVQAVADPEASFGDEKAADTVADRAWGFFRGVGREAMKAHNVRVFNLDAPAMVGSVDLGLGTEESALARVSFTVELVIPTVVYVDVPTIERATITADIIGGTVNPEDIRKAIEDELWPCRIPLGDDNTMDVILSKDSENGGDA